MPRIIEIRISPQGEITLETHGYVGSDCLQASKFLEQALGLRMQERKTTDFYQAAVTEPHIQQQ